MSRLVTSRTFELRWVLTCNGWYKRITFSKVTLCHRGLSEIFLKSPNRNYYLRVYVHIILINNVVFKILNNSFHFGNHLLFRTRPCWIWYTLWSLRLSIRVQLSNNPYAFMQYPYTMPAAPFYGYFQTPMRAAVPNPPCTSSQNGQASSSSASQNWNWIS